MKLDENEWGRRGRQNFTISFIITKSWVRFHQILTSSFSVFKMANFDDHG